MMSSLSDVEWIYIVLAALYASELLVWVRPGVVAVVSSWGLFGSRITSRRLTGNEQGDLVLGGVAPFDVTVLAETFPLSITDEGVVAFVAAAPLQRDRREQSAAEFNWSQLTDIQVDERAVRVAGQTLYRAGSTTTAELLARELRQLAAHDDASRAEAIASWRRQRFDVGQATKRWNQWQEATLAVRFGAMLLFLWICPVGVLLHYGWLPLPSNQWVTLIYLSILFSLWWLTAIVAWMAHGYLYPDQKLQRWKQLLYSLLSPAVPLRLADQLGRPLFGWTHPLAISAAVDTKAKFTEVASHVIRDATYPRLPDEPPSATERAMQMIRESRAADDRCLAELLAAKQLDVAALLQAPKPDDESSVSYCPRCLHEFVVDPATCDACGGRQAIQI